MHTVRLIACLDIEHGRVVKGVRFADLQDQGDPVELAARYDAQGIDELAFLDVRASDQGRDILRDLVRKVSEVLFIPFAVGGGLRSLDDVRAVLRAGADKVTVGSAAVANPELVRQIANEFGSQCLVVSLDVKRLDGRFALTSHGGRRDTGLDAVEFAKQVADLGAGELLVNDMDADGTRQGFGHDLNRAIVRAVPIPVIASGGAGKPEHFAEAVEQGGVHAVLAASVFHQGDFSIRDVKDCMLRRGIAVST